MIRTALLFVTLLLFGGCSYGPGAERWKEAVINAATDSGTWIPAAGAVAAAAGGVDKKISDWAGEETPVFGSQDDAQTASDRFQDYTQVGMVAAILVPHENDTEYWMPTAGRGAVAYAGIIATDNVTGWVKEGSKRERPNHLNTRSFPSGHSSMAFYSVGMTNRNIDTLPLSDNWKYTAKGIETTFGIATAWSRVEAGMHYPSDVLAGAALGNFLALLLHDVFLKESDIVRVKTDAYGTTLFLLEKRF